jgi:hypothetical protein
MSDWRGHDAAGPDREVRGAPRGAGLGLLLIAIGALALLRELTDLRLQNWWALFILIPGLGSLWGAFEAFLRDRAFTQAVRGGLIGACFPFAVALIFLLDASWADWWPVFVILPGLGMVSGALPLTETDRAGGRAAQVTMPWLGFAGLGVVALGFGFLGGNLGWYDPAAWHQDWWAVTLLAPSLGGLVSAFMLVVRDGRVSGAVVISLAATAVMAVPGIAALSEWGWDLVAPLGMIAAGLVLLVGYLLYLRDETGGDREMDTEEVR